MAPSTTPSYWLSMNSGRSMSLLNKPTQTAWPGREVNCMPRAGAAARIMTCTIRVGSQRLFVHHGSFAIPDRLYIGIEHFREDTVTLIHAAIIWAIRNAMRHNFMNDPSPFFFL